MFLDDINFSRKLTLGFGLVLFLFAAIMAVSYVNNQHQVEASRLNTQSYKLIQAQESLAAGIPGVMAGVRGYLLSGHDDYIQAIAENRRLYDESARQFRSLAKDSPGQLSRLESLDAVARDLFAGADQAVALRRRVNAGQASMDEVLALVAQGTGRVRMDQINAILKDIEQGENAQLAERTARLNDAREQTRLAILGGGSLAVVLGVAVAVMIGGSILRPLRTTVRFVHLVEEGDYDAPLAVARKDEMGELAGGLKSMVDTLKRNIALAREQSEQAESEARKAREAMAVAEEAGHEAQQGRDAIVGAAGHLEGMVDRLTSSSTELAAQVEQTAQGAQQQKQSTEDTAAAMLEMQATVGEVAQSAARAAETAGMAKNKAQEGAAVVEDVVRGISAVQARALTLKEKMGGLGKQAEGIGDILNVIADIADQTNLLALNAAIEAARAGEAGRGFAVVADEVRKLAEKTMAATSKVAEAITSVQQGARENIEQVDASVEAITLTTASANRSGAALTEIVRLVDEATDQVRAIASASEQQAAASEQIGRAVEDIHQISSETSQAMVQSAQAVVELSRQAGGIQGIIERMLDAGGTAVAQAGRRALAV
ncbi:methyl-accepting chemotaxis protein [Fundidesulfovibrio terrae]|uniref:methyl-accepting chemotaxis protein n=1 Tax=Fundidesulfovibrio terrae TaxID=2922866 RepID=UPI001FAF33F0|nr:methyl-accepting chemotaxis protein [Fundidesulfovibrio terrae]